MTDLLQNTSYDHIVLVLCFTAVIVTGSMMHLSVHIGNLTRGRRIGTSDRAQRLKIQRTAGAEAASRDKAA